MSERESKGPDPSGPVGRETEWQRRRRLAAVFGEVLPDVTTDEQPRGSDSSAVGVEDTWWREQVPPHHGG